jgi:hypothetical protein
MSYFNVNFIILLKQLYCASGGKRKFLMFRAIAMKGYFNLCSRLTKAFWQNML